jgi:hypothetical protein
MAMAHDASAVLGAQQVGGVKVNPLGFAKRTARKFGGASAGAGAVGAVSVGIIQAAGMKGETKATQADTQPVTPQFGVVAWLAVTERDLALVELKRSRAVGLRVHAVIERVPRGDVASAQLGRGILMAPPLTLGFADGKTWQLEVPPTSRRSARKLVRMLAGG